MNLKSVLAAIDKEIATLQAARALYLGETAPKAKRGRPAGKTAVKLTKSKKNTMSAEGRARIAAAQKKRWAASKKAK